MFTQMHDKTKNQRFLTCPFVKKKNKRAVSIMIGYILLITFAVVISGVVYTWLKSYVPKQGVECPDGVSLYITSYENNIDTNQLTLNLRNNGKFSIGGIFIYYTDSSEQKLATLDLSNFVVSGLKMNPGVKFPGEGDNAFKPNEDISVIFDVSTIPYIYSIEITPVRWQEENTKILKVSCNNAGTKSILDLNTEEAVQETEPDQEVVVTTGDEAVLADTTSQGNSGGSGGGTGEIATRG